MKQFLIAVPVLLAAGAVFAQQPSPPKPAPQAAAPQPVQAPAVPVALLQGLDKVTAHVSRLAVKVGEAATFGSLTIHVDACVKRPPEEPPESAAFLRIIDRPPPESATQKAVPTPQADPFEALLDRTVFSGWMFASSPALHPLEHPVFDVILLDCRQN